MQSKKGFVKKAKRTASMKESLAPQTRFLRPLDWCMFRSSQNQAFFFSLRGNRMKISQVLDLSLIDHIDFEKSLKKCTTP